MQPVCLFFCTVCFNMQGYLCLILNLEALQLDFCFYNISQHNLYYCIYCFWLCTIQEAIYSEYGVCGNELRVYFHYQPSYYHLHVHFTHLKYVAPKTLIGQAHLLDDVIDNIENIASDCYQKRTISFCVKESSALWQAFEKNISSNTDISWNYYYQ